MNLKNVFIALSLAGALVACQGENEEPVVKTHAQQFKNLDVSQYDAWTYINLETGATEKHADTTPWVYTDGSTAEAKPADLPTGQWHIAIHRYEIKTNGGKVLATGLKDLAAVKGVPEGNYVPDEVVTYDYKKGQEAPYKVITDMKQMMKGKVGYSKEFTINKPLYGWIKRIRTGSMPPEVFEPTKEVFVVKFDNGEWAKMQFTDAGNTETNKSGFVTFEYEFSKPVKH